MKINFKKPKFILPLIALPFILIFYFIFGIPKPHKNNTPKKTVASGLQTTVPGVDTAVANTKVKDKFITYQDAFKHLRDSSAIIALNTQANPALTYNSTGGQSGQTQNISTLDSLNDELQSGQDRLQKALSDFKQKRDKNNNTLGQGSLGDYNEQTNQQILAKLAEMNNAGSSQPENTSSDNQTPQNDYDEQMKLYRSELMLMDSLDKVKNGQLHPNSLHKNFNPAEDTSFKPLSVSISKENTASVFNTVRRFGGDAQNAITAMIDQNIKVTLGSRVRMRLLRNIYVGGNLITKGTYLYGVVTGFQTQRINISIASIKWDNTMLPVNIDVYDNDGYLGLYVPGSNFREFTKQIGTQATQGLSQVVTPDASSVKMNLLSQLFNTTTTTMAALISKNKAFLKYDYIVYLKENKTSEE